MAELRDPDLPPGAVVEVDEATGEGIRNCGGRLKPAEKNPWYVLATIAGVQEGTSSLDEIDEDLAARNRRYWNGWACAGMSEAERAALADKLGVAAEELAPLSDEERAVLEQEFRDRLGPDLAIPEPSETIDCSETFFPHTSVWAKCAFSAKASFDFASFCGLAIFRSTYFGGDAEFAFATFSRDATFISATMRGDNDFMFAAFSESAVFEYAIISGLAFFANATFSRDAEFTSTAFREDVDFERTLFRGYANFSNMAFEGQTVFEGARFEGMVPMFYQRQMHQDTTLTTRSANWPVVTPQNAGDSKRAYARLRQIMNELQKPDEEHFFFRQEMTCKAFEEEWWNRWPIRAFGALSDFGYSVARPVAWLLALWIGTAGVFYRFFFSPGCYAGWGLGRDGCGADTLAAVGQALALSFANIFPFGLNRLYFGEVLGELPGGLQVLGGAQTVLGFVLLFFLGLGLRNRFRLK